MPVIRVPEMVNTREILRNYLAYTAMGEHVALLNVSEGTRVSSKQPYEERS